MGEAAEAAEVEVAAEAVEVKPAFLRKFIMMFDFDFFLFIFFIGITE